MSKAPPPSSPPPPAPAPKTTGKFAITRGRVVTGHRFVIYGQGGIGKTTLATLAPNPVVIDLEGGTNLMDCPRVGGINTFAELIELLSSKALNEFSTIAIDSWTKVEDSIVAHAIANVKKDKGETAKNVEDYGYGKGYKHVYDFAIELLGHLDRHHREGRHSVIIAHETTATVPNPSGEDHIAYQPWAQQTGTNGRIRDRLKSWCDHMAFIAYDKSTKDGKAVGRGTRQIYLSERPTHWAKSRSISDEQPFANNTDDTFWTNILKENA